jgi:predicted cobalt transporter CbtA
MHAMPGDTVELTTLGPREQLEQKLAMVQMKAKDLAQRHGRMATGIALAAATAFGVGMLVYRRRRKTSMMGRAQRVMPESVWDMPEELIAQIKKPLQRAAKAL